MPQLKQHATIVVENDHRALKSRSPTDFTYQLTQPIKFNKRSYDKQYYIRIENIRIPISFYNINSTNNTFGWNASGDTYSVNIPPGNYTIDDLKTEVEASMDEAALETNDYTFTYDEITQKINIASDGADVTNAGSTGADGDVDELTGTGWKQLGFDGTETITGASNVTGSTVAYTNTMRHLKLQIPNLVSNNVYSNDENLQTQVQPIGVIVPITEIYSSE